MTRIAIDGGQSALRLRVLPSGRTGEGPGYTHGPDALHRMLDAIRTAAVAADVTGPVELVALGLTGYPQASAEAFAADVGELLDADEVRLTQDMVTAHAGALPDGYGVVVAAGTGLVCLAVDRDGTWRKLDGHGYLFGDAGSAFAIGRAGLVAVQRARDGRGPVTKLADTALDPVTLYRSSTLVDDVARFAPEVLRCAAEGDPVAHELVVRAAGDIAETIEAAVAQLAGEGPVPVACVGGLFAGAGEQLLAPVRDALPSRARLTPAAGNSLDGAERLATGPAGTYADLIVTHRR
ncbi:N-acetylglucosamine kinase [Kribbella jiaozuonensis]|uniref:ATPase n=1 Tax=Kribbella jiaozuonensis TaxID=2575441 RepID=A0A4V5UWP7_9ACTN|nr:BadF/BadG/BcrA/BcrD ATPase family protein [Kribbella jiaozuonensis]TKK77613.1 ATPase [Kribbella jiaozuonensis]